MFIITVYAVTDTADENEKKATAHWSLDENGKHIIADEAGKNSGFFPVAPHAPAWEKNGKVNSCLSFDGVDDYIEIRNSPDVNPETGPLAVSGWFKTGQETGRQFIINKYSDSGWSLELINGYLRMNIRDAKASSPSIFAQSLKKYGDKQWHYFVAVWAPPNVELFVDGKLVDRKKNLTIKNIKSSAPVRIGNLGPGGGNWNFPFKGEIDEIKYYKAAFSPEEVVLQYKSTEEIIEVFKNYLAEAQNYKDILARASKDKEFSQKSLSLQNEINEISEFLKKPDTGKIAALFIRTKDLPKRLEELKNAYLLQNIING